MACIIHYQQFDREQKLLVANENNFKKLIYAKKVRCEVGGQNLHQDQCDSIPESFKDGLHYHRACYQKFINVYHLKRKIAIPVRKSS